MENEVKNDPLEEIEPVSKSQLKRESRDIQNLGRRLTSLSPEQLSKIPLDEPVLEAIALAQKIQNKRSALKRHYQFLGKLLRVRDTESIFAALAIIDQSSQAQIKRHHEAERWRDEIIANGNQAIETLLELGADADRQKLRQLWRNHNSTNSEARKTQASRLIYQEIIKVL
jgi:ribosome-associated protein